jgi:hypothetical protein
MTNRILPKLDSFISERTGKPYICDQDPEAYADRAAYAVKQFLNDVGDAWFGSDYNSQAILAWLDAENVPVTRFNLGVARNELFREGKLENRPVEAQDSESAPTFDLSKLSFRQLKMLPRGPVKLSDVATHMDSKSTVKLNYTMPDSLAGRQLLEEEFQNRREMCPIGQPPKTSELGHQYRLSLLAERNASNANRADFLAARQRVVLAHPEIPRDGTAFGRLVLEELNRE